MSEITTRNSSLKRKASLNLTFAAKRAKKTSCKKLISILQKNEEDRTPNERQMIVDSNDSISVLKERLKKINAVKSRNIELEDDPDVLEVKCKQLANAIQNAKHVVVYTGAGISTAAKIPDYRGTKGIWTLLQQGKDIGNHDLSLAEPTLTHMALYKLHRHGLIKHVVSQNCDDLHLRSGLPRKVLSEVHGNMSVEVCAHCEPVRYYWRVFDVTEHTGRYAHMTARKCPCGEPLLDTIIHFGEKGVLLWPLNWAGANKNADKADLILCVGSSLKVLRKYGWIWGLDKPKKERPKLFIINLQWTPKDEQATLKINGKCDAVFTKVMSHLKLEIPAYDKLRDPIFYHSSHIIQPEYHTVRKPMLEIPEREYFESYPNSEKLLDSFRNLENYQNTTVFVKEEDEIQVKEENIEDDDDVKEESGKEEDIDQTESKKDSKRLKEAFKTELGEDLKVKEVGKGKDSDMMGNVKDRKRLKEVVKTEMSEDEMKKKIGDRVSKDSICSKNGNGRYSDVKIDKEGTLDSEGKNIKTYGSVKTELKDENGINGNGSKCNADCKEGSIPSSESKVQSELPINLAEDSKEPNDTPEKSRSVKLDRKSIFKSEIITDECEISQTRTESSDTNDNLKPNTSNISDNNIKNILKNFRRAKKSDKPSSNFSNASVHVSSESREVKPSSSENCSLANLSNVHKNCSPSVNSDLDNSITSQSFSSIGVTLNSDKADKRSLSNSGATDTSQSNLSTSSLDPSSENSSGLPRNFSNSSTPSSSSTLKVPCSTSFSTLISSAHSKCECRSEMDLQQSNNEPCYCVNSKSVTSSADATSGSKFEKSNITGGGTAQSSIIAIVKPLPKESSISTVTEKITCESLVQTPLAKVPFNNSLVNTTPTISSNSTQDNINILVTNQINPVIAANPPQSLLQPIMSNSQPLSQPMLPLQVMFPNPSLVPPFIQPHPVPNPTLTTPLIQAQQVVPPLIQTQELVSPVLQSQQISPPIIQPQQIVPPLIQTQQVCPPLIQTQQIVPPVIQSRQISPSVIQSQQIVSPVIQTQQIVPPVIQSRQISPSVIQSQQIVSPVIQTQQIISPVLQSQQISPPIIQPQQIVPPGIQSQISPSIIQSQQIVSPLIQSQQFSPPVIQSQQISPSVIQSQHITQPVIQSQQIVSPLFQSQQMLSQIHPFLQQQILHQNQLLQQQQLLSYLMNGNLLPNNMIASQFPLTPFLPGIGDLQTPFQFLPQPLNLFPNQPLIYLQQVPINPSIPTQMSPNVLLCPVSSVGNSSFPIASTLPNLPMQFPPSLNQPDVSNISNISLSTNCVQSSFDNNPSSRPNIPLGMGQIPLNVTLPANQGQSNASSQSFSTFLSSNVDQSVINSVPIFDTGQAISSAPSTVSVDSVQLSGMNISPQTPNTPCSSSVQPTNESPNYTEPLTRTVNSSQSSPSKENYSSPMKSLTLSQPRIPSILSQDITTLQNASPSKQFNSSPNKVSPLIWSPLKSPRFCRVLNPLRSPVSPLFTPNSPRTIRTIRPFQFKNELSIPEDLIFEDRDASSVSKDPNVTGEDVGQFPVFIKDKSSPTESKTPLFARNEMTPPPCSLSWNEIAPMSRTSSCPDIANENETEKLDSNSERQSFEISSEEESQNVEKSPKTEENPLEGEPKKRGRKPKANKEDKQEEVYHYSLPQPCEFCTRNYDSSVCLFYERQTSLNVTGRKKTTYCNCCTYTKTTEEVTSVATLSANPGWFGKGYRKNIKRKRSI